MTTEPTDGMAPLDDELSAALDPDDSLEIDPIYATQDDVGASAFSAFSKAIIAKLDGFGPPDNGVVRASEFHIGGSVPRREPYAGAKRSQHIYMRLENKVYGPVEHDGLLTLMRSGNLTGYESATIDFVRWTPLAYHPDVVLSESVDPDMTHDVLAGMSDLPAPSQATGMAAAEAFLAADEPPLAAILSNPRRKGASLPLPVVGDLEKESIEKISQRVTGGHESITDELDAVPEDAVKDPTEIDKAAGLEPAPKVETTEPTKSRAGMMIAALLIIGVVIVCVLLFM